MKYAILFLIVLAFASCQKEPHLTTAELIQGVWKQSTIPHAVYSFASGICTRRVISAGIEVWRAEYAYICEGDTVTLKNIVNGADEKWAVTFETDDKFSARTGSVFVLYLERM